MTKTKKQNIDIYTASNIIAILIAQGWVIFTEPWTSISSVTVRWMTMGSLSQCLRWLSLMLLSLLLCLLSVSLQLWWLSLFWLLFLDFLILCFFEFQFFLFFPHSAYKIINMKIHVSTNTYFFWVLKLCCCN